MRQSFNLVAFTAVWNNNAITVKRIAAAMNITPQGVRWRAKSLGLAARTGNCRRKHDPALLREMWLAGVSGSDIGAHFGLANGCSATRAARVAGLPPRERGFSGMRNGGWKGHLPIAVFWERKMGLRMQALADQDRDVVRTKNRVPQ